MTDRPKPADAADALALAICHLWRAPAIEARRAREATVRAAMTGRPVVRGPVVRGPVAGGPVAGGPVAGGPVVGGTT
jgi:crossover junction endodeoxyribonuclease RuvC